MRRYWIAVASADHIGLGRAQGFMQVCHGKATPLRRIKPGDCVAYYSPTLEFGGKNKLQAFTAIGIVKAGEPYPFTMNETFCPFRRDVDWLVAEDAPIQPLLKTLEFSAGGKNWGYQLRFGLFQISEHDSKVIASAMRAEIPEENSQRSLDLSPMSS